jgi:hypothetical protein
MNCRRTAQIVCIIGIVSLLAGCSGRPSVLQNSDKSLRKSSAEFAADAAKRHPYKNDAPRGGQAQGRAQVGYMLNQIDVVNLSEETWTDVEVWVNQKYVVFIPEMKPRDLKRLNFQMIFDDSGKYIPTRGERIEKLEILRDGKLYDLSVQLGD